MWAGGRIEFIRPIRMGDTLHRVSEVREVALKDGKSGPLVFVLVVHELSGPGGVLLREEHDIVYREAPAPGAPPAKSAPAPQDAAWTRTIVPDPVMLFRYSALTFNGHRIHYDQPYATKVEGYPGLVVHGPLIATLLMDLLRREKPDARLTRFEFRALSPLFDTAPFALQGRPGADGKTAEVWAKTPDGALAMTANAVFG